MDKEKTGLIAVMLGNAIFGFSFLFSKIALSITVPSVVIAVRFFTAFLLLNIIVAAGSLIRKPSGEKLFDFSLRGKPLKYILLLALFQPIVYYIAENYGIVYTSSSFAGVIISLIPLMGIFFDRVILGTRVNLRQILCACVSVLGVVLTTVGAEDMKSSALGIVLLLVAVCASALFYVFSSKSSEHYDPLERTYVMFACGTVFYVTLALVQCMGRYDELLLPALTSGAFWGSIGYLACVSSVGAFLLLNYGSGHIPVTKATMLANITTVISIIAGVVILGESFTIMQAAGAVMIIISVYAGTASPVKKAE